ncbi:hypothetical protein AAMO2058_001688100 [Amorphochlora amoebiformis]
MPRLAFAMCMVARGARQEMLLRAILCLGPPIYAPLGSRWGFRLEITFKCPRSAGMEGIRTKKGCSGSGVVSLDVTRSPYSSPTTAPTPFSRILTFKIETVSVYA